MRKNPLSAKEKRDQIKRHREEGNKPK